MTTKLFQPILRRMELYRDLTTTVRKVHAFAIPPDTKEGLIERIASHTSLTKTRAEEAVELALKKDFIELSQNGYRRTVYGAQYCRRGLRGRIDLFVSSYNTHPSFIATLALITSIAAVVVAWTKGS